MADENIPVTATPEPAGLDDFLAQPATAAPAQQQPQGASRAPTGEPPGLDEFLDQDVKQDKYGGLGQQALAGIEGAGRGLAGPVFTGVEKALGASNEGILGREEANPVTAGVVEAGSFLGSMLVGAGEAALVGKAGAKVAELSGLANKTGILGKFAPKVVQAAAETSLLSTGDEVSKMIVQDPNQTAQTAIAHIGLAGLLGAGAGAAFGAVSPLWKASVGDKMGRFVEDFKGRMNEHLTNPEPVQALGKELGDYYKDIKGYADEVYGPTGLKAQDVAKAVPEMSDKIMAQTQQVADKLQNSLSTMIKDPDSYAPRLVKRFQGEANRYMEVVTNPEASSVDVFNATQDLKSTLQGYSKFDKFVKPVDEAYDFVRQAKSLSHELRTSLEDSGVWGKAADRQQAINGAFKTYLPALEDFERKFTSEVGGERVIDPAKVNTYVNQLGKPNAELKQTMLKNFIDASEKYKNVISDTHANLGLESPIVPAQTNMINNSLKNVTPGMKLADAFVKKGLGDAGGKGIAAAVGASIGHIFGSEGIGALIGEHTLGPFFNSVLPAIVKPLLKTETNSLAAKTAMDYGNSVVKGEKLLDKATKSIFKTGEVLPNHLIPTEQDRVKLDEIVKKTKTDPTALTQIGGQTGHYLPEHATALAQTTMRAVNYLNSIRPNTDPKNPLDKERIPSAPEKAKYDNALNIAQQPLVVLAKLDSGRINSNDIIALRTMYPDLYNRMTSKISDQLLDEVHNEEPIKYHQRIALSLFLGKPLDSSMTPQAILAAQPKPQQNQPQTATEPASSPKHSANALNKFASAYQTPNQTAEQRRTKA